MAHVFEPAPSARSKCRGCERAIAKGELRFGEEIANAFAEGETTHLWFHPLCAAYRRPEPLLALLAEHPELASRAELEARAHATLRHRRLCRIARAERAPSSQAKCRQCHAPIARDTWRIALVFHEDGRFSPGGYVHLACRRAYFELDIEPDPILHFSHALAPEERAALARELEASPPG